MSERIIALKKCVAVLTFTTLLANSPDDKLIFFFLFCQTTEFDISCKLSPLETICMKCQNLFQILPRVLSIK